MAAQIDSAVHRVGGRLYVRCNRFIPGRPTLILMHGLAGSLSAWAGCLTLLQATHNLVLFDLRGHGRSARFQGSEAYALRCFVDDIAALIDELRLPPVILAGHSFGALVAASFAATYPRRVRKLILISPRLNFLNPGRSKLFSVLNHMVGIAARLGIRRQRSGRHIDYGRLARYGDFDPVRLTLDILNTGLQTYLSCLQQASKINLEPLLHTIQTPTLLIHGARDGIFRLENSRRLVGLLPHAELEIFEDANHIVPLTHADALVGAISRFTAYAHASRPVQVESDCVV